MVELTLTLPDSTNPSAKIIAFSGEMDETSIETVKPQIDQLLNDTSIKFLIFDLTNLEFINSKGIGYLVSVHTHLSKDQRELILTGANETVMDVISLVGLTSIVKYFKTTEEAMGAIQ